MAVKQRTDSLNQYFAFFHEAGQILLHGKKMLFLELAGALDGKNEEEAGELSEQAESPIPLAGGLTVRNQATCRCRQPKKKSPE